MSRKLSPLDGVDLSGPTWSVTAPIIYKAGFSAGRQLYRAAVTKVVFPVVAPESAPVVAEWRYRGEHGEDNARAVYRAYGGRVYVCDQDVGERRMAIDTLALGRDPGIWRELLRPGSEISYARGRYANEMTALEHPLARIELDESPSASDVTLMDDRPTDEPAFLDREAFMQKEAARRLVIDGRIWSPSTGPAFTIYPGNFDLTWIHPRPNMVGHSLAGMGLATEIGAIEEAYRARLPKAQFRQTTMPRIIDATAFSYPAATISLLDAAWGWLSKARGFTLDLRARGVVEAAEDLKQAFRGLFPEMPASPATMVWDRTWLYDPMDLEAPLELSQIEDATLRLLENWPDKKPATALQIIEIYGALAAREYARSTARLPDEGDETALGLV